MRIGNGLLKLSIPGLLMAGLLLVGGTGFAQETAKVMPDAEIEANVLKALADVPQLKDQAISTTTVYGQVTLTGTVRDEASRDMAEQVAADAPGVKKVVDELAIGTVAAAESAPAQDQGSTGEDSGQVLQSDGTYAPAPESRGQSMPDDGEANAEGAPPPPPQQGPNQPDGQYRQPYGPPYNQQSAANTRTYTDQPGGESIVVPKGALIRVRINEAMNSKNTAPGTIFDGVVLNDVIAGNAVAIPRGAAVQGRVVDTQSAGALKGKGELALQLTQITLGGQTYPVVSDAWTHQGADKTGQTVGNAVGLGAFGAMIGAIAGGGPGALLGAGLGGAAGLGVSAASGNGDSMIPAEAILTFHLAQQVPLVTVSQAEMNRLASGVGAIPQPLQRRQYRRPYPYSYYGPGYYPY